MLSPTIETWLKYAPQPGPLPPNARYHVFISYRSVNRSWVLQLYDLLRELNYEVFPRPVCTRRSRSAGPESQRSPRQQPGGDPHLVVVVRGLGVVQEGVQHAGNERKFRQRISLRDRQGG